MDGVLLLVDGEILAVCPIYFENTYINIEHPNTKAVSRLFRETRFPLRLTKGEIEKCLSLIQPSSNTSLTKIGLT